MASADAPDGTTGGADPPLRFSNEIKLRSQMRRRGWSDQMIREAMQAPGIPTNGKKGPATRYVHPTTGRSVVVDNATGEIFHVGGEEFRYDD
ncbi:MAG TPA: colicin E5-related ribonuclease [Tepidisphaeraceae bacterium]|nr:colicin E5-related ribonuclease [Tepidisphaeraceae bacterium]